MQAVAAIIGAGSQGAQPGRQMTPMGGSAPIAPAAPGQPGVPFGGTGSADMSLPTLPKARRDAPEPYGRTGFGAGLDTAATLAKFTENPAQALVERMAGSNTQAGEFAQKHPQMMGIVQGLFQ